MTNKFITAKDIAGKYEVSYQTINRYSDAGLLNVAFKKGNVRFYDRLHIQRRLIQISRLTRDGYSLNLIRKKILGI
jgi:DNA-binding transcriptional MerR regulator